jgi:arylsulfatase A
MTFDSAARHVLLTVASLWLSVAPLADTRQASTAERPNIVFILADDLGYGDIGAFNTNSRVPTPNVDRLAREGVRFTDAHSNSAVCTPTRYGLLTGRYAWRTDLGSGVLWGEGDPLIDAGRMTLPSMLKKAGYATAGIGKWHLGLGWAAKPATTRTTRTHNQIEWIDYTKPYTRGPTTLGFDQYFGIVASLDMPPYVYLEGDRVAALPTATLPGVPRGDPAFYRAGPASPGFHPEQVLSDFTSRAATYIEGRKKSTQPFFLYVALAAPHTPVMPSAAFRGKTGVGVYADFVAETDAAVGQILQALDRAQLADRTLVVFTSDNGPAPLGGIAEAASHGHDASGGWRGVKAGLYEGGHRVPFIVRWPGRAPAGERSIRPIVMTDVMATIAESTGIRLPRAGAEDSISFAANLLEPVQAIVRQEGMVLHSQNGSFAIRQGPWKLILTSGPGAAADPASKGASGGADGNWQLYNLDADPKETLNRFKEEGAIVERLRSLLDEYRRNGRSRPE